MDLEIQGWHKFLEVPSKFPVDAERLSIDFFLEYATYLFLCFYLSRRIDVPLFGGGIMVSSKL